MKIMRVSLLYFCFIMVFSQAQTWHSFTEENSDLINNDVRAVCIDEVGNKWFGTINGLTRFDGTTLTNYQTDTSKHTLADNRILDIAYELSSYGPEIFIATENGISVAGIDVDALTFATPYRSDNPNVILTSNRVMAIEVDERHARWFGTD